MSYIKKKNVARNLRKKQSFCEKTLWEELRNKKLLNLKFRRQYPINKYIVDFFCYEKKLIIELDGPMHDEIDKKVYDDNRQRVLEYLGYKVIRFKNSEIVDKLTYVLEKIQNIAENI